MINIPKDSALLIFLLCMTAAAAYFYYESTLKGMPPKDISLNTMFYEEISEGVLITKNLLEVNSQTIKVNLVEINPSKASLGISSPNALAEHIQGDYSSLTLEEYAQLGNYMIVQSGGFLSAWSPPTPLGYVKIQGVETNPPHVSWITKGVFCTNGDSFKIFEYTSHDDFEGWRSCIQAGPILLKEGEIVLDTARNTGFVTKEDHKQSFICRNEKGNLLMGLTDNVRLIDFVQTMALPSSSGGLGCIDATLLTSKGIAGILAKTPIKDLEFGNTRAPIPTAIIVRNKKNHSAKLQSDK